MLQYVNHNHNDAFFSGGGGGGEILVLCQDFKP